MVTHDPIPIQLKPDAPLFDKLRMLLGHYDLRVYLRDQAYIDVGRGSFDACFSTEPRVEDFAGCIGTVGQFCNFAQPSHLLAGGEHWNDEPVNVVFSPVPALAALAKGVPTLRTKPPEPFTIGNAVVVSARANILSGVKVGDGAVIGTAAVVTQDVPAFAISAGVPAKVIRQREQAQALGKVRWWDFDMLYLANNMSRLQELAVDEVTPHVYRRPTPRVAIRIRNQGAEIAGFLQDGVPVEPSAKVRNYIAQLAGPGPYYWLADMWAD